jgi:cytochrome c oxidase cbb3-type subunit III
MRFVAPSITCIAVLALLVITVSSQEVESPSGGTSRTITTPDKRSAATREFLGLGTPPDKVAAARAAPVYQRNCSFCHGPQARGANAPGLVTSYLVLSDDHGEHLAPFLKVGRPEKGMPAFSRLSQRELIDLAEFLHQQVEDVANRGAYQVRNIVVGNSAKGRGYVMANCMMCHTAPSFVHIATKFHSPDQLQRSWIWPPRSTDNSLAITAEVTAPGSAVISGRVTQMSDFRITLMDSAGQTHVINRAPGVDVQVNDPLAAHQALVMTLKNDDMHNVTAYLETFK